LENLRDREDIRRAWENIKENIKTPAKEVGLYELKQLKPWFDEEYLRSSDQRKHAKFQWLQDPSQSNVDNPDNVKSEANAYFRNKKKRYMRARIDEFHVKYDERRNRFFPFLV
jgi:hypothetical protein